jgi:enoyl-CoA hydratase
VTAQSSEEFSALTLEVSDGIAEITLTRPELMNRVDAALHTELTAALDQIARRQDVRASVLASTGRVFSAGGDFELMRAAHDHPGERRQIADDGLRLLDALIGLPQPLVVALHGAAIGVGATVVLTADAIVAARSASLSDPHVALGLVAGDGGCLVWPASTGMLRARRHLLTGDALDAETAFACGLVTDLVDTAEEALPAARALAARIAKLPPMAVQGTKAALNRLTQQRAGEVVPLSMANEVATFASEDLLEAIASFQERRPGNFRGR